MHTAQSTVALSAPQNETNVTLVVTGNNPRLTEMIHEMCRLAIKHAVEPLQESLPEDALRADRD